MTTERALLGIAVAAVATNTTSRLVAAVAAGGIACGRRVAGGLLAVALSMWALLLWTIGV